MEKYRAELSTLKEKLQTSEKFSDVMKYFFDHLAERDDFIQTGKRAKNPVVKKTLEVVGQQLFQEDVTITNLMLTKIKKQEFYHGTCFIQGRMATIIYFEDIDIGMAAVVKSLNSSYVEYVRFTCYRVNVDEDVLLQSGNRTIH